MNNIQQGLENHPQFDSADVWLSGLMFKTILCAFVECIVAIFVDTWNYFSEYVDRANN